MVAAAAAAAGPVASVPAGSLSSSGSLGLAGSAGLQAAGVVKLQKQEQMPAELRISAARAERKKKTEVGGVCVVSVCVCATGVWRLCLHVLSVV